MGQQWTNLSQKLHGEVLRLPAARFLSNIGFPILTLVVVFSGLPGSQEDLKKMGVYLGQCHL
jgi:hypothetical protein